MSEHFDVAILGSGVAARTVAQRCHDAGRSVLVVDERPLGGTCLLRGCDPKKLLRSAPTVFDGANRFFDKGLHGHLETAWSPLMAFKRSFTRPAPEAQPHWYQRLGITALRGHASFTGPRSLRIGDDRAITADSIVIATGARPVPLPVDGAEHLAHSDTFLDLDSLPRRIAFVGGGYIAAELSHLAALMGAQASVIQRGPRLLKGFDADLVARLMERFRDLGIEVHVQAEVRSIQPRNGAFVVRTEAPEGTVGLVADLVVHAAGRAPDLDGLDLERAGVSVSGRRLALDHYLRSLSNPAVYAAGDAAGRGPPLTPVASIEGEAVAANILHGHHRRPDYHAVPSVVFTLPPLARVGLDEDGARRRGLAFRAERRDASDWLTARVTQEPVYASKVLIEDGTGRILGAHLVGPHADETINLFALAMRQELTAPMLKDTVFAYPTAAADIAHML